MLDPLFRYLPVMLTEFDSNIGPSLLDRCYACGARAVEWIQHRALCGCVDPHQVSHKIYGFDCGMVVVFALLFSSDPGGIEIFLYVWLIKVSHDVTGIPAVGVGVYRAVLCSVRLGV